MTHVIISLKNRGYESIQIPVPPFSPVNLSAIVAFCLAGRPLSLTFAANLVYWHSHYGYSYRKEATNPPCPTGSSGRAINK